MTVSSETNRVEYIGNGSTGPFGIPFPFTENSDIVVVLTNTVSGQTFVVATTSYTVLGAGNPTGSMQFTSAFGAPGADWRITILRDPQITQLIDYIANDKFPAETHERGLDKLTMICQRLAELQERSVRFPDGDAGIPSGTLPTSILRASKYLAFDSNGNIIMVDGTAGTPHVLTSGDYVPTWANTSGPSPSIGDGTLLARWVRNGNIIDVKMYLLAGAATTFGSSGVWTFSLPFPAIKPTNALWEIDPAVHSYAAGQLYSFGFTRILSTDLNNFRVLGSAGVLTYNNPGTWANGGQLVTRLRYEVAP